MKPRSPQVTLSVRLILILTAACQVFWLFGPGTPVHAQNTYTVSTLGDTGTGSGLTGDLRYCITQADATPGSTITFSVNGTIVLSSALPAITSDLVIHGPGAQSLIISGGNQYQVLAVAPPSGAANVAISGVTVANGYNASGAAGLFVGPNSTVSVDDSIFSGNSSSQGAAILNQGTQLTIRNSTLSGNSTVRSGNGGAVYSYAPLIIISSTFSGNAAYQGAAIYSDSASATITNATFANNSAADSGTIFNNGGATLTISDNTFAGNLAPSGGLGIANLGSLAVTNTIFENSAECSGSGCPVATDASTGNVVGPTGLRLAALGYYGGPTQTLLPFPGSTATCAGLFSDISADANNTDQRGFAVNPSCVDSGAVQTNYLQVNTSADSNDGPCSGTGTCSLRDAISTAANEDIDFAPALQGSTITLSNQLPTITGNTVIVGPGAAQLTISGAGAARSFFINPGTLSLFGLTISNGNAASYTDGSGGYGGAVVNGGVLSVNGISFAGNTTGPGSGTAGGAIYNANTLVVTNSTFSNNTAAIGSAIYNNSTFATAVTYSTFTANTAWNTGALFNNTYGTLLIDNSTFAGNVAGGSSGVGSGILNDAPAATSMTVTNSLVQDDASGTACASLTPSQCPAAGDGKGNTLLASSATELSPLGSFGGTTSTIVPLPGSSAICAGLQSAIPAGVSTDQRGYPNVNASYTGYSSSAPCVDSGAVQTNYTAVQWVQQPTTTAAGTAMSPAPSVRVLETNSLTSTTDAVDGIPVALTLNGPGTLTGGSATTAAGVATFGALSIDTAGTGDTLSTDAITVVSNASGTTTLPAQTSSSFNIDPLPLLSIQLVPAGTFTQGSTAEWIATISNSVSAASTTGTTYFSDTLPTGYTISGFGSTSGWSCSGAGTPTASCTATQSIAPGSSYPQIDLVVNVPATSPASVSDTAFAWGGGDTVHSNLANGVSATSTVTVVQAGATTTTAANAALAYSPSAQTVSLAATVTSAGGSVNEGSVAFTVLSGSSAIGTAASGPVSSGTATASYTIPAGTPAGTYAIHASYTDSTNAFSSSSDTSHSLLIGRASPVITWSAASSVTYGTALAALLDATAAVAGSPVNGTFSYEVQRVGGAAVPATASTILSPGNYVLIATFTPTDTADYSGASVSSALSVTKAVLTVVATDASRSYGVANPAFTGSVTGAVNGDSFTESFATSATISSNPSQYSIVPTVLGTNLSAYSVVVSNGILTVTKAATSTTLSVSSSSANPGAPVTISATVASTTSGTPTGSVSFYDGSSLLQTVTLSNGIASYSNSTLSPGVTHAITAVYSGDLDFMTSSAAAASVTVAPLTFSVAASPSVQSGQIGQSFTYQIQVTPTYGAYPGTVQFTATGIPTGMQVSFSPSTLAANAGQQTVQLTVNTGGVALSQAPFTGARLIPLLALLLLPFSTAQKMRREGNRLRGRFCLLLLALTAIGAATALTGCGTDRKSQSFSITITATSAGAQQSTNVALDLR